MESFTVAAAAVVPFVVYLALGAFARRVGWVSEETLANMNHLSFRLLFPFTMFSGIYRIEGGIDIDWLFVGVVLASVLVVVGASMAFVSRLALSNPRRGVIVQALYRTNLILFAFPLANSVYGDAALLPATQVLMFVVAAYNILAVPILDYYGHRGSKLTVRTMLGNLAKNPIIQGIAIGALFQLFGLRLPGVIEGPVLTLGEVATPIALLVLGGPSPSGGVARRCKGDRSHVGAQADCAAGNRVGRLAVAAVFGRPAVHVDRCVRGANRNGFVSYGRRHGL